MLVRDCLINGMAGEVDWMLSHVWGVMWQITQLGWGNALQGLASPRYRQDTQVCCKVYLLLTFQESWFRGLIRTWELIQGLLEAHFSLPAIWLCMTCGCQNVVFEYLNLTFICLPTQVSGTCKLLYVLMFSCFMLRHGISSLRVHSADLFGRVAGCNHASVFSGWHDVNKKKSWLTWPQCKWFNDGLVRVSSQTRPASQVAEVWRFLTLLAIPATLVYTDCIFSSFSFIAVSGEFVDWWHVHETIRCWWIAHWSGAWFVSHQSPIFWQDQWIEWRVWIPESRNTFLRSEDTALDPPRLCRWSLYVYATCIIHLHITRLPKKSHVCRHCISMILQRKTKDFKDQFPFGIASWRFNFHWQYLLTSPD